MLLPIATVAKEENKKDTKQLRLLIWHLNTATHRPGVEAGIPPNAGARPVGHVFPTPAAYFLSYQRGPSTTKSKLQHDAVPRSHAGDLPFPRRHGPVPGKTWAAPFTQAPGGRRSESTASSWLGTGVPEKASHIEHCPLCPTGAWKG